MGGAYTLKRPYPANEQVSDSHSDLNARTKSVSEYVFPLSLIVKFFSLVYNVTLNHGAKKKSMNFFRSFFWTRYFPDLVPYSLRAHKAVAFRRRVI